MTETVSGIGNADLEYPALDGPEGDCFATGENGLTARSRPDHHQVCGIHLLGNRSDRIRMMALLHRLKLLFCVNCVQLHPQCCIVQMKEYYARQFLPKFNTLELSKTLHHDLAPILCNVEAEIVFAMLAAPQPLTFPNVDEFIASVNTRIRIAYAAQRTRLAFETSKAERPQQYWRYDEQVGYTVIPGQSLITALEKATQPEHPNATLYSFSCYRATEYVILHAIAQELAHVNPNLARQLQQLWEVRPVKSGEYHEVFLHEYGSLEQPLPIRFYIPGDRVWFRNPDYDSSNVSGYEGSWVIYLGGGLFSNFWKYNQPYTFVDKCLEIYHWRLAVYIDEAGEPRIDEDVVEARLQETRQDPERVTEIIEKMARPRDPKNVFAEGGCADVSREFPKSMCVGTAQIRVPHKK